MKRPTFLRAAALLAFSVSLLGITGVSAAPANPGVPMNPATILPGDWSRFPTPGLTPHHPLYAVTAPAVDDAWAVGAAGGVYHFDGLAWSQVTSNTTVDLQSVSAVPGTYGAALVVGGNAAGVGNPSVVLACTTSGCTAKSGVPDMGRLDSVWAVSADDYWVAGGNSNPQSGVIMHFSGGTWSGNMVTGSVPNVHYHNIQMLSSSEGYAVGEGTDQDPAGRIVHYTSAGGWQRVNTGLTYSGALNGLWFISPDEGWAVGGTLSTSPVILHYRKNHVPAWTKETVQGLTNPTLLWFVNIDSDGSGYASGNDGLILWHQAGNAIWSPVFNDPSYEPLYGVWVVPGGAAGWAVGGTDTGTAGIIDQMVARPLPPPRLWLPLISR